MAAIGIDRATDILGLVDVQPTFMPGGELPVADGDAVVPIINRLMRAFDHAFATQDWHPPGHSSFASAHPGRKPYDTISHAIRRAGALAGPRAAEQRQRGTAPRPGRHQVEVIIRKGFHRDIDSYSTFFENDRRTATGLDGWLRERNIRRVFLAGLATDFCVAWSAEDAARLGYDVVVIEDACRGIGVPLSNGRTTMDDARERLAHLGVRTVNSDGTRGMTTWLVTGGAGFIGSHLCEALVARGDSVRVLDDLSTGKRENLPPGTELIEGHIADAATIERDADGVAGCFHLAAIASVHRGVTDWLGTHRANLTGAITLFDTVRRLPAPDPVVYASSAAVYGDAATVPITEATDRRPLSAYGADKYSLRAARARCQRGAWHPDRRPALLQRLWSAAGSAIALFRCHLDLLRSHSPGVCRSMCSATAARRVTSSMSAMSSRHCSPRCGCGLPTHRCSMSAPARQPRCWSWRTIGALRACSLDVHYRPARAGEIRHSTGSPALAGRILGLPEPLRLRDGLFQVIGWLDASG